jgi:hypothetical protein
MWHRLLKKVKKHTVNHVYYNFQYYTLNNFLVTWRWINIVCIKFKIINQRSLQQRWSPSYIYNNKNIVYCYVTDNEIVEMWQKYKYE